MDDQIKIRGFRVELGEVEAALATCPAVRQAVATVREDRPGDRRLVGYVISTAGEVDSEQLRQHVARTLPDYMVPAIVVGVDAFPLTPNGKVDRAALPVPEYPATLSGGEPRTVREEVLCRLFAEVLGLEHVGVDDAFFALGGDSIMSIQLVSRARRAGLVLSARDVFEQRTPAGLARIATEIDDEDVAEDAAARIGPIPLTPIMHWFAELGGPVDRLNQWRTVQAPTDCTEERLLAVVQSVLDHHDALRLRGTVDVLAGAGPRLEITGPGTVRAADCVRRVDASGLSEQAYRALMTEHATAARQRLSLAAGLLIQVVWFDRGPAEPGRIFIDVHHLAVDAVSWGILLPDMVEAWSALRASGQPRLQPIGTSLRRWTQLLDEWARQPERAAGLAYFTQAAGEREPLLGRRALDPERDVNRNAATLVLTLPTDITAAVLTTVPELFHAGVNDVLLAALAMAVVDWRRDGPSSVLVDLESHGRAEDVLGRVDLSRTMGWFTSMYPVRLDVGLFDRAEAWAGGPAMGELLKRIKEGLRAVPEEGLSYGALRYLNARTAPVLAGLPQAQIGFNYLGRVAESTSTAAPTDWSVLGDLAGVGGQDPAMPLPHALELAAVTRDTEHGPELVAHWLWPAELFSSDEVRVLGEAWFSALTALVRHAGDPGAGGHTPSDVGLTLLSQSEIDLLEAEWRTPQ